MRILLSLLFLFLASMHGTEPARTWQGIPGLERTAKGRLFVSWYTGGEREPSPDNTALLSYSDDGGKHFGPVVVMAGPVDGGRAFDPTLWMDPLGRLWYIYNRGNKEKAQHFVEARICEKPDARTPVWGAPFRVGFDEAGSAFRMNKPIVLSTGEWVMPVTHAKEAVHDWFARDKQLQGVGISTDKGRTWKLYGAVQAPAWALENMIVELKDKRLWMLIRTGETVLWESYSSDRGKTWSEGRATTIASPRSRFFVRRLRSGNLLLVNHYKFTGRSHLTAQISRDDGKTWSEGLVLDERAGVSYPDGVEGRDGVIRIVYDHDRRGAGEILMSSFREKDTVAVRQVVDRLPWDPEAAANKVMQRLVTVTGPEVKGAHDAEFVIAGGKAYIVMMANDVQPGESAEWAFVYVTMSVVDLKTMEVLARIPVAKSGEAFANETLQEGSIFVPRIVQKDSGTLRVFFASEAPRKREAQSYYRDFDLRSGAFEAGIHRMKIQTAAGVFDMQPVRFYEDAAAVGFKGERKDYGLYTIDSFKEFGGTLYVGMNNYPGGQNGLAMLNPAMDAFVVVGHIVSAGPEKLTELAVNKTPGGTWFAILRQEGGTRNYMFSTSKDGRTWTAPAYRDAVPNGWSSKPNLDKFFGTYYLGWQESTRVNGVSRSVFNVDVSTDGVRWERRYRFATDRSFQYASFHESGGSIYLTVTQGDSSPSRKEKILFGKLE